MRTAASEHLNHAQIMTRLGATFGALIHEQIDVVRRYLDDEQSAESSELGPIAELSVRLVERSAEWLEVTEVANLALEMREAMAQLGTLRPFQRQEILAQCRVALAAEERLADRLRAEGFAALVAHAAQIDEAVEALRATTVGSKSAVPTGATGVIDGSTPDVGPHENLLALTFEIKNSLVHQNERICSMSETVDGALHSAQHVLGEWEGLVKSSERLRMAQGGTPGEGFASGKTLAVHQGLQDLASNLRTVGHELTQVLGLQYSLERRARDLDEHLLWEFLDPLERYVDDLYAAVSRERSGGRIDLRVQTGGVGFEPQIGSLLVPLLARVLETAEPEEGPEPTEVRLVAAREGLEARLVLEGRVELDEESLRLLENALEGLGGFATMRDAGEGGRALCLQFPMARSLRSFLIIEAGGQRMALPWSAVERIHASDEEPAWSARQEPGPVHSLSTIFGSAAPADGGLDTAPDSNRAGAAEEGRPLAVLRCGSGAAAVGFDRIVWRENARLKPLPARLNPAGEILGGIVAPDGTITLVLNPSALLRRLHPAAAGTAGRTP